MSGQAQVRAHAQWSLLHDAVHVHVSEGQYAYAWGRPERVEVPAATYAPPDAASGLLIPEDVARAVYEALAQHFGHVGHDGRALRKDYEAERARVDRLIEYATRGPR